MLEEQNKKILICSWLRLMFFVISVCLPLHSIRSSSLLKDHLTINQIYIQKIIQISDTIHQIQSYLFIVFKTISLPSSLMNLYPQLFNNLSLPQIPLHNQKYFKLLTFLILVLFTFTLTQAKNIKTPESWRAEAGAATFTILSIDTFNTVGDYRLSSNFAVNLRILQLFPQTYQIVLGFRKIDALFSPQGSISPSTSLSAPLTGDSSLSTTFNMVLYMEDQRLITQIKANYLLIGFDLISTSMVNSVFIQIMSPVYTGCDGLTGAKKCKYNKATTIPALTYKIYLSICSFDSESKSTTSMTTPPSQTSIATRFDLKLKSFTLTNLQLEFDIDKFKFNTVKVFAIIVHPSMFDQSVIKHSMFFQLVSKLTNPTPFSAGFAQKVFGTNYFVGFFSFKGFKWSYQVKQSNPIDFFLGASISASSNGLEFFAIVMYGYTQSCDDYRYCIACYTAPNYECTQCDVNFILTPPYNTNTTCQCPTPFTIVSGVCDNHPFGCIVVLRLADDSLECQQCDFNKMLILNPTTKACQCEPYFVMDSNSVCQQLCGDGVIVNAQCDDGNINSGDGCSSSCGLETGFDCDTTVQPTKCKSQSMLFYRIDRIIKDVQSNSAIMKLYLPLMASYPLPVLKQHFNPVSQYINFRIILSMSPYTEIIITDFDIIQTDSSNAIYISFNYNQTIQGTKGKLILNYQNTLYFNYTQTLDFSLVGDNAALFYQSQMDTYKNISYGMLAATIINSILLLVGLVSPKFIGVESILTLQLVFFSQTLIFDHMKFPVGFLFLQTLQYSTGYNNIFDFTDYYCYTENAKKMQWIKRNKTIIENFNINFILLLIPFIALLIVFVIRSKRQRLALLEKQQGKKAETPNIQKKQPKQEGLSLRKINDIAFYICNQVAFWLFLPLFSSIAAQMIIENSTIIQKIFGSSLSPEYFETKAGEIVSIPAFFIIYAIIMSNFGNIWQSNESMSNAYQRPEQIYYKRWLFCYLTIVGFLVFYFNGIYYMKVYTSLIVFIIHLINMIVIFSINPYKMSLKVHTIGIFINNTIYLVFLIIVNFINYMDKLNPTITIFFGYGMIALCMISIIVTLIRLYYELRFGRELEMQLQEERLLRQKEEALRKQAQMKNRAQRMENQAKLKLSEKQKIRQRNVYLYENQVKQDNKKDLVNWLENRPIDKKVKQSYFFQKFAEKPLEWLKANDQAKYDIKISELNEHLHKNQLKAAQKLQDQKYIALTAQLRKEVKTIKKIQEDKVRMHEKALKASPDYSMVMRKDNQEKFVHRAYQLKE